MGPASKKSTETISQRAITRAKPSSRRWKPRYPTEKETEALVCSSFAPQRAALQADEPRGAFRTPQPHVLADP